MISSLSSLITEALYKSQVIAEEDKELYVYGFFVLLSKGLFFLVSAFFGWMFGVLWESIVFYIMFSTLRSYAGGFHASKESICTFCTTASLFLSSLSIWHMERIGNPVIPSCILTVCGVVVYLLAPLDSEEKPLTRTELALYRQKTREMVIVIWIISIIGLCYHISALLYAASISMLIEGGLLALGKFKREHGKKNTHQPLFSRFFLALRRKW